MGPADLSAGTGMLDGCRRNYMPIWAGRFGGDDDVRCGEYVRVSGA
jgi:hypothetical protein